MVLPALAGLPFLAKALGLTAGAAGLTGLARAAAGSSVPFDTSRDDEALQRERSGIGEFFDFLGQTSQPLLNLFAGRPGAAGRQALDVVGKTIDAGIPGDAIPQFARPSDFTSASEIIADAAGIDREDIPGVVRFPVDVVGDVFTSPASLLTAGGAGAAGKIGSAVDDAARVASEAARKQALQGATSFGRRASDDAIAAADEAASVAGQRAAQRELPEVLERQLSSRGRRQLRLDRGGPGQEQFVRDLIERTGGDVDEIRRLVGEGGELAGLFRQGGLRFAGQQVLAPGAVTGAVRRVGERVAPNVTGRAFDLGEAVVGGGRRTLASITGNLSRFLPPGLAAGAAQATARGNASVKAATDQIRQTLGDVPEATRQQIADVFFNVGKRGDKFERLTDILPDQSFMRVDDQVDLAMQRAAQIGVDLPDDVLRQKLTELTELNRAQFAEDVAEGVFQAPSVWQDATGRQFSAEEIIGAFETGQRRIGEQAQSLLGRVETKRRQIRDLEQRLSELGTAGAGQTARAKQLRGRQQELQKLQDELTTELDEVSGALAGDESFTRWASDRGLELTPVDTAQMAPPLYLQRQFSAGAGASASRQAQLAGSPSFARRRTLRDDDQLAEFLNQGDITIERDALKLFVDRARQQGSAVTKARAVRNIMGDNTVLGRQTSEVLDEVLEQVRQDSPDLAAALQQTVTRPGPRTGISAALAKFNRFWKPNVLYGIGIPKVSAITKNRIGALFQELSVEGAQTSVGRLGKDLKDTLVVGARDGLGVSKLKRDELGGILDTLDDAYKAGGGTVDGARAALGQGEVADRLREAIDTGVLDGFIDTEKLLREMSFLARRRRLQSFADMPGTMFQNVEHRLRLAQFMDLRKQGVGAQEAARLVRDTYLDYTVAGRGDQLMRDIIPFVAFVGRSIPQQLRALGDRGALRQAYASALESNGQSIVLPPHLQEQASIPFGTDREGNPQVIASLGLPIEALRFLPGEVSPSAFGELTRDVASSTNPLVKAAATQFAGRDPFFGQKPFSFDRTPRLLQALGAEERSETGRVIQGARSVGAIVPVAETLISQTDTLLDSRRSIGNRLLNFLTGVRIASVDEDRAIQQVLEQQIENDPRIRTAEVPFAVTDDPETRRLLEQLSATRARLRAKREAQGG